MFHFLDARAQGLAFGSHARLALGIFLGHAGQLPLLRRQPLAADRDHAFLRFDAHALVLQAR